MNGDKRADTPITLEMLLSALAYDSANVVEVWRYALSMMIIGDEAARIIEANEREGVLFLCVETDRGEQFHVIRPPMSDETEQLLLEEIRKIMREELTTNN